MLKKQTDSSPFGSLPVELVRFIVEFAARADSLSASRLVRVSRAVRSWALTLLYETLVITSPRQCILLHQRLSSSRILAQSVKNISIRICEEDCDPYRCTTNAFPGVETTAQGMSPGIFQFALVSLFQLCQNVSNISLTLPLDRVFRVAACYPMLFQSPTIYTTRLTELHCASWDAWVYFSNHLHLYTSLTHLRVDLVYNSGLGNSWSPILRDPNRMLPNLTHLAFAFDCRSSPSEYFYLTTFGKTLLKRERLESLVVLGWYCWDSTKFSDALSNIKNPRLKALPFPGCLDETACFVEWNSGARGDGSVWDRALKSGIPLSASASRDS